MKKITNILKTMALSVIVFVMAQSCIPTTPTGGNPTPNYLIGKIRSINFSNAFSNINTNIYITYNSTGLVTKLSTLVAPNFSITNNLEYEPNKVIIKDSVNTTTGDVCFLKTGTVLLDSIYSYDNGNIINKTKIERDGNNNLIRILVNDVIAKDSFVYFNNNIVSYIEYTPSSGWIAGYTKKYEYEYDNTKTIKSNINPFLSLSTTLVQNIDIIGVSIGNTSQHPITKIKSTVISGNFLNIPVTDYNYANYTNNLVKYYLTPSFPGQNDTTFITNTYY